MLAQGKKNRDSVLRRRKTPQPEVGWVDRTHLIFQYYQILHGNVASQHKGALKSAIPIESYNKLQATFSRALKSLTGKKLIYYANAFGKKATRRLTERRIGVCPTDKGLAEITKLVGRARRSLGDGHAQMTRKNIKAFLDL